jgi:1,4-dihydroxy-2-naphthoyl-CoA hydrolase
MPQKRNPDVFELMRGRSAVAQAALNEVLGITQKLTSGYHRDLQLIKPPLFRGIDSCLQTLAYCRRSAGRALPAGEHPARSRHSRRRRRECAGGARKASRFARPTGAWPPNSRIRNDIWRSPESFERLNAARGTMIEHLGIEFTEIGADFIRAPCPSTSAPGSPTELLHGGASVALAETLGSMGAAMCVDVEQYLCVGQEINANHVRAARSGLVTGTARPVHLGGRTQVWSIEIVNEAGKLVCISRLTVAVIKRGALALRSYRLALAFVTLEEAYRARHETHQTSI